MTEKKEAFKCVEGKNFTKSDYALGKKHREEV